MGPRPSRDKPSAKDKGKDAAKDKEKAAAKMTARERQWAAWWPQMAFFDPGCDDARMKILKGVVASDANEHKATVLRSPSVLASERSPLDVRVFYCFLCAGLVPPMSTFLHAVLTEYGLLLAQLHPNGLLVLAIFQFLCEFFVGVMPSVALFRHYFGLRVEGKFMSGGVTFCLRDGLKEHFLNVDKKRWEEWRHEWCYVRFPTPDDLLAEPSDYPKRVPS